MEEGAEFSPSGEAADLSTKLFCEVTRTLKQSGGGVFTVRVVHGHMLKAAGGGGGGGGVRRLCVRVCVCQGRYLCCDGLALLQLCVCLSMSE